MACIVKEEECAGSALVAPTSMQRNAVQTDLDASVRVVLADDKLQQYAPALAAFMRNHTKSMVTRSQDGVTQGSGEISTGRKLFLSLFKADRPLGERLLFLLP